MKLNRICVEKLKQEVIRDKYDNWEYFIRLIEKWLERGYIGKK